MSGRLSSSKWVSGVGDSDSREKMMRWTRTNEKLGWLDRTWAIKGAHKVTEEFGGENESTGNDRFLQNKTKKDLIS